MLVVADGAAECYRRRLDDAVRELEALARDTHKFESRYLDSLVGPYPERQDIYQ